MNNRRSNRRVRQTARTDRPQRNLPQRGSNIDGYIPFLSHQMRLNRKVRLRQRADDINSDMRVERVQLDIQHRNRMYPALIEQMREQQIQRETEIKRVDELRRELQRRRACEREQLAERRANGLFEVEEDEDLERELRIEEDVCNEVNAIIEVMRMYGSYIPLEDLLVEEDIRVDVEYIIDTEREDYGDDIPLNELYTALYESCMIIRMPLP